MSLFKEKGDALEGVNYCSLELTEHVLKVVERIIEDNIHSVIKINAWTWYITRFNNIYCTTNSGKVHPKELRM